MTSVTLGLPIGRVLAAVTLLLGCAGAAEALTVTVGGTTSELRVFETCARMCFLISQAVA